jgi:hypothetical protein
MQKQKLLPKSKNTSYQIQKHFIKHYFSVCRRWTHTEILVRQLDKYKYDKYLCNNISQFVPASEAAEAFQKWRGIGQKGHFCIWPKSNDFLSFTSQTKFLKIWSLHNVGNGIYRVFTTAKRAFPSSRRGRSFKKYCFRSVNGSLWPPKSALFSLLKKVRGTCPHCLPGSAAPARALRDTYMNS